MKTIKFLLYYLFITNVLIGIWALFFAYSFYENFPGFGFHWISIFGPYNDHLVRDVGAYFIAMGSLPMYAIIKPEENRIQVAAYVSLIFGIPHLVYHLMMMGMFPTLADKIVGVTSLSLPVLFPAIILRLLRNIKRGAPYSFSL
ncbi:hypothetical protein FPZ43_18240 [Mucilaginibacter pallidiroseus]|uniref:Uncharacterized protein n=1 Tax=Mucilaginibacter pallidiroseus TaxID=2599295 RepID=A0A563U0I4_9SPHI|nr:hypothetical protein [Mucilaginibacter pallidiroseus]TWR24371.1 hypothetical protein FPZ43_18240 [Mucilaginibacter pallidiroseus]